MLSFTKIRDQPQNRQVCLITPFERRANYVAVTFSGLGCHINKLKPLIEADMQELAPEVSAKSPTKNRPNPGLVVAVSTEAVDNQGDFIKHREKLAAGLLVAQNLRSWLLDNEEIVGNWFDTSAQ